MTLTSKNIYTFLFISLLISCNNVKNDNEVLYEPTEKLTPISLEAEEEDLLVPSGFDVLESGLLTIESKIDSNKVKYFSRNLEVIHSFGKSGKGPDEFSEMIRQPVSTSSKTNAQLYDWSKKRLSIHEFTSINNVQTEQKKVNEYILPPDLMLVQHSAFINDSTVVSSGGLDKGYISFTDVNTDKTNYFNPIDFDLSNYDYREKSYLYESFFGVNNEKELIAVASKFMPELHIINYDQEIIAKKELFSPSKINLSILKDIEDMKVHFFGVAVSEEFIYATYVGKSTAEMDEIIDNNEFQDVDLIHLYKFDWKGNFIKSYLLEGGLYPYISIDENQNRLYSLNSLSDRQEIVYFEID